MVEAVRSHGLHNFVGVRLADDVIALGLQALADRRKCRTFASSGLARDKREPARPGGVKDGGALFRVKVRVVGKGAAKPVRRYA